MMCRGSSTKHIAPELDQPILYFGQPNNQGHVFRLGAKERRVKNTRKLPQSLRDDWRAKSLSAGDFWHEDCGHHLLAQDTGGMARISSHRAAAG
jgi:hypothetical protein